MLDDRGHVVSAAVWSPTDVGALATALRKAGVRRVAIDAPDAASTAPHVDDRSLSPKFRSARCGEVALGRDEGIWVSWVTPTAPPFRTWMEAGFALFEVARAEGLEAVEVYPHAAFRALVGGRLASKATPAGIAARVEALRRAGVDGGPHLAMWSHDGLDAAVAAVVAADPQARAVTCGHDGSAIWLPSPLP